MTKSLRTFAVPSKLSKLLGAQPMDGNNPGVIPPRHLRLTFVTDGRKPQCPTNPRYPYGKIADLRTHPLEPCCSTNLGYPAKACGTWVINCHRCGLTVGITAAGRPDDPWSAILACKPIGGVQ